MLPLSGLSVISLVTKGRTAAKTDSYRYILGWLCPAKCDEECTIQRRRLNNIDGRSPQRQWSIEVEATMPWDFGQRALGISEFDRARSQKDELRL